MTAFLCLVLFSAPTDVIGPRDYLTTPIAGLERTQAISRVDRDSLSVKIGTSSAETNATQLTILNTAKVERGDLLLARFSLRGDRGGQPARVEMMFEKSSSPWTKSITFGATGRPTPTEWRQFEVPFTSSDTYAPGEAMLSFRMAFGRQRVELKGVTLVNYGKSTTLDQLYDQLAAQNPPPPVALRLDRTKLQQEISGMGGNFCQPRYGSTEAMDRVGNAILSRLNVAYARIGVPLNHWAPMPGVTNPNDQAKASFEAMKLLKGRGLGIIASVWEGPVWMMGGKAEEMGRELPADRWKDCITLLGDYFVMGKEKYGVVPDYFSFNEPDLGVNVRFSPEAQARFIREASKAWRARGLNIKFLVGDTANGQTLVSYAEHLMKQRDLLPVLGPFAYHTWDALSATEETYQAIAAVGRKYNKKIWGTEAGHDAQLWQRPNPWGTWENAHGLARAYARSYRLSGAERLDYWTYQDNYTLLDPASLKPHPAFETMKAMEAVFAPKTRLIESKTPAEGIEHAATVSTDGRFVSALVVNQTSARRVVISGLPASRAFHLVTGSPSGWVTRRATSTARGGLEIQIPTRGLVIVTNR